MKSQVEKSDDTNRYRFELRLPKSVGLQIEIQGDDSQTATYTKIVRETSQDDGLSRGEVYRLHTFTAVANYYLGALSDLKIIFSVISPQECQKPATYLLDHISENGCINLVAQYIQRDNEFQLEDLCDTSEPSKHFFTDKCDEKEVRTTKDFQVNIPSTIQVNDDGKLILSVLKNTSYNEIEIPTKISV